MTKYLLKSFFKIKYVVVTVRFEQLEVVDIELNEQRKQCIAILSYPVLLSSIRL